ncbi:MAG: hypothetical protein Fur0041_05180 [Bacteroidia bacterium]
MNGVRIYGNYPGIIGGVPLRVSVYNVDGSGRPVSSPIYSVNTAWYWYDNFSTNGMYVPFGGGGVYVNNNFAVSVEIRTGAPYGQTFQVQYTGNGEGLGEDLASLAGTSTGQNWASAMTAFNKDGDFYILPSMTHFVTPAFSVSSSCIAANGSVSFTNNSTMTQDSMFNTIGLADYTGSNFYYTWNFGDASPVSHATSPSHTYASAGSYTVSLTCTIDGWNNNCSFTTTQVISVGLASTATTTAVSCNGGNNGSATITATGGAQPYTYSINGVTYGSSNTFSNLAAGTYTLYAMDAVGCITTSSVTVTQPTAITFTQLSSTNAACSQTNGSILASATGGTGNLQYQLNAGPLQSTGAFNNLAAGTYTVTVVDGNQCTQSSVVVVNNSGGPTLSLLSYTNVSCNGGNDGSIVVLGSGGTGQLQYSIDGGNTWQTSGTFSNVAAGIYGVLVKDNAGCHYGIIVTITQPGTIQFAASEHPVTCNGGNDGSITIDWATGGIGTYSYSLDNVNYQSSSTFNGLLAGTYTVYIRDAASCINSTTVTVTQPTLLVATATATPATCNGEYSGTVTVTATGGTPGYMYSINSEDFQYSNVFNELGAGTYNITVVDANGCIAHVNATVSEPTPITATITTGNSTCGNSNGTILAVAAGGFGSGYQYSINGTNFFTSGNFTGLASGIYNIIVRDGAGCESVFTANIIDSNGPTITAATHTNVSCNGGADGTITVGVVTGGTGQLQYSVNGSDWQTSTIFNNLIAGTYTILVKDANGCVSSYGPVTITQPNAIVLSTTVVNVSCHGDASGSVTISAAGGAGQLAFSIDMGQTFQSSNVFNGLTAGQYMVIVRDAAGCEATANFAITEPSEINVFTGVLNVSCNGGNNGAFYVVATGGTPGYQYSLDGVNYQTSNAFTGLVGGTYTLYVRDNNGCVKQVPVEVIEPNAINIASNVYNVSCAGGNDGVIDVTVSGGISQYTYAWSTGATTEDIFNLTAGTYTLTVTDANGCNATQTFNVGQPVNPLIVNGVISNASSQTATDGGVDITITGGSAPYTYLWSNGATTEDITGVAPGVYTVAVTDANGCVTTQTYTVSFNIGIDAQVLENGINVYPNPAREQFTVEVKGFNIDRAEVYNVVGQVIYTEQPNAQKVQFNTEAMSNGMYFIKLYINDQVVTRRIEVVK